MGLVAATLDMGYGQLRVEPGMVFTLQGFANDQRLLDIGYLQPVEDATPLIECPRCGAQFVGAIMLQRHARRRHA
jgi:hypothetical protein